MKTSLDAENKVLKTNIEAIRSILALVRTTIGPKGLDVMLVDEFGNSNCTNDGIEILRNVKLQHPAAKLAVSAIESQELQSGDGTTTCSVYIDAILASAEKQIERGCKANRLAAGIKTAVNKAQHLLEENSKLINTDAELKSVISISARGDSEITELAFQAIKESDSSIDLADNVLTSLNNQSKILNGVFIKKKTHFSFPNKIKNASLLLIEGPLEPEPMSSEVVSTEEGVKKYENNLQSLLDTAKKIIRSGAKIILAGSSMYPTIEEYFVKEGVLVLTHVNKKHLSALSKASGATLTSRPKLIYGDLNSVEQNLGKINLVTEIKECAGFLFQTDKLQTRTILISAQTQSSLDEKERILIDALKTGQNAKNTGSVLGEGIAEMNIISSLRASETRGNLDAKDLQAGFTIIEDALKAVLWQIIDNAGLSYQDLISQIKFNDENKLGYDLDSGEIINLEEAGIRDSLQAKLSALNIAAEFCAQILRINAIVQAK